MEGIKKQINALSDGQDVLSGDLERVSYADMERWSDNPNLRCTGEGGIYYKDNSWWFGSDIADGLIKIEQNLSDSEICLFEKGKKCKKIYYIDKKPYLILDYSVPNVHEKYISVYPNGERIVNEILDWTNPQLEVDYYKYAKEISQNGKFKKCDLNAVKNTNNVFLYNGERMNGVYKLKPSNPYSDFCINEYSNGDLIKTVEYSPFAFPLRMQEIQDDKYLLIDFNSENHSFRSVKLYTLV